MAITPAARRAVLAIAAVLSVFTAGLVVASSANAATYAQWIFQEINKERASIHVAALRESSALDLSASRHNSAMAGSDTLTHQASTEPSLGARVSATGFRWSMLAENVGMSTQWPISVLGVLHIEKVMWAEGPGGAHYTNIANPKYTYVGVSVLVDTAHHRTWMTVDFGRPL